MSLSGAWYLGLAAIVFTIGAITCWCGATC